MSRITNYSYTDSSLLKRVEKEGQILEIIRPEENGNEIPGEGTSITEPSTKIMANGFEVSYESSENGYIKNVKDNKGNITNTEYNRNQQPISIKTPDQELEMTYDEDGNMIQRKDIKKGVSEYFEYEEDKLIQHKDSEGRYNTFEYEGFLLKKREVFYYKKDANGDFVLDSENNKIPVKAVIDERKYNPNGQLTEILPNSGPNTLLEYDANGNVSKLSRDKHIETYNNDLAGNVLKRTVGALERGFLYDNFNCPTEVQDNGNKTSYIYDNYKRLIEIKQPNGQSNLFSYDVQDRLIEKKDPKGNSWKYEYNAKGELKKLTKPDLTEIQFEYDEQGNASKISSPGFEINQLFDLNDKLISSEIGDIKIEREYLLTGQLHEETFHFPGNHTERVKFKYDKSGAGISVKTSHREIQYGYDNFGLLSEVLCENFKLSVEGSNRKLPSKLKNPKFTIEKGLAGEGETTTVTKKGSTSVLDIGFNYDSHGNSTGKNINGLESWVMGYNAQGELTSADLSGHSDGAQYNKSFQYDGVGNRIKENNFSLIYDAEGFQLLEDENFKYEYDLNGNIKKKISKSDLSTQEFSYNPFDQMTNAIRKSSSGELEMEAIYTYDGIGRRVGKEVTYPKDSSKNKKSWYTYDRRNVLADLDENFAERKTMVSLNFLDHTLGFVQGTKAYYFVKSKFNTVDAILDDQGNRVARYTYGPFGELVYENSSVDNDFLYLAREFDREIEAYYLRARHYDPYSGRFFQLDPDAGKLHNPRTILLKYAYSNNNPLRYFDPDGRDFDFGDFLLYLGLGLLILAGIGAILGALLLPTLISVSIWGATASMGISIGINAAIGGGLALIFGAVIGLVALGGALIGGLIGGFIADEGKFGGSDFWQGFSRGAQIGAFVGAFSFAFVLGVLPLTLPIAAFAAVTVSLAISLAGDQPFIFSSEFWE